MDSNITSALTNHISQTRLVTIGILIVILITAIVYNLYTRSEYDSNGNKLSVGDTFRNMCGLLPSIASIKQTLVKTGSDISSTAKKISKKLKRHKEVFNIDNNVFTYDQAKKVCKAYDSKLATYDQLKKAHKAGANWCNYGWSADKMALYPIQKEFHEKIESSPTTKGTCGKVGVNGGVFNKTDLKFGVNCYGYKPYSDPNKIVYENDPKYKSAPINKSKDKDDIDIYKKLIKQKTIEVRPFNNSKWSNYSFKKSRYMLTPKNSLNVIIEEELTDNSKDPRNVHSSLQKPVKKKHTVDLSANVV